MRCFWVILIFLGYEKLYSWELIVQKIDQRIPEYSLELLNQGKYREAILYNQKIISKSQHKNDKQSIILGYCKLSYIFCVIGKYKQALSLVHLAEEENRKNSNKIQEIYLYAAKGNVYASMNLYRQSIVYNKKAIALSSDVTEDKYIKYMILSSYNDVIFLYKEMDKPDSAFYYCKEAFSKTQNPGISARLAYFYANYKKRSDSAKYYLQLAKITTKRYIEVDELSLLYRDLGNYYESQKQYDSAKLYYTHFFRIADQRKFPILLRDSYKLLSHIAELQDDKKSMTFYLKKYAALSDSISRIQKIQLDIPIEQYINENKEQYKKKEVFSNYIILGITFSSISLLLLLVVIHRKKEKILKETVENKEEKIEEQETVTLHLKNRIGDGFNEVVLLAQKNRPEFLSRFLEVYPEFYQALLKIYPDINPETLRFCALLRLSFSSKEITNNNFITPRAIQLRKNRIRKKLNISSEEDIYEWMLNLDKKSTI